MKVKKSINTERFCGFCNTTTVVAVSLNLQGSNTHEKFFFSCGKIHGRSEMKKMTIGKWFLNGRLFSETYA